MAGFAVNINHLNKYPNASMPYKAGYEEDSFLKSIGLKIDEIEPKASDCTEVYVWHTQTTKTKAPLIKVAKDVLESSKSNLLALLKTLSDMGVSHFSGSGGKFFQHCNLVSLGSNQILLHRCQSHSEQGWESQGPGSMGPLAQHVH